MAYSIGVRTSKRCEFVDITAKVRKAVKDSGIMEGICRIFTPHTTAALTINENADPSVRRDIIETLREIAPVSGNYSHAEGNSDAHIKSSLLGHEKNVFIENGLLKLGTWQGIFFCEFDGPRNREVWIKIDGDKT